MIRDQHLLAQLDQYFTKASEDIVLAEFTNTPHNIDKFMDSFRYKVKCVCSEQERNRLYMLCVGKGITLAQLLRQQAKSYQSVVRAIEAK
ncbi:hypothetical protein VV99796_01609 [Vibrio vulnificus]|uniref:hypothetical protein n=1 Tax=Vibrio vulnificus TaxID=672 RepID=UPI000926C675|nr:hypothetical protein [Vibrio vulnificus]EHT4942417.1 hypothetical protein [Vibrio vulnificus]EID4342673.1 hypothetical protein [Vibrio vulnificus]OJI28153.1 hypothetical protein VV99796_01609 [Vibrio vulnificus]OJI49767.1 hypothetical protein VVS316_01425 [Vibrio vulnificus]POB03269.1 hypothetical protein CRN33_19200 [Vibrio vulnificus]